MSDEAEEMPPAEYLRNLAARIRHIAAVHGVDGYDVDRLLDIATLMENMERDLRSAEGAPGAPLVSNQEIRRQGYNEAKADLARQHARELERVSRGSTTTTEARCIVCNTIKPVCCDLGDRRAPKCIDCCDRCDGAGRMLFRPPPTVGSIVHYSMVEDGAQVAAIVTRVEKHGYVFLTLFPACLAPVPMTHVGYSPTPKPGHWSWP